MGKLMYVNHGSIDFIQDTTVHEQEVTNWKDHVRKFKPIPQENIVIKITVVFKSGVTVDLKGEDAKKLMRDLENEPTV